MSIVGGLDIHRKQLTFDYLDTATGQVTRGQVSPADREHLRAWLARFASCSGERMEARELTFSVSRIWMSSPGTPASRIGKAGEAMLAIPLQAIRTGVDGLEVPCYGLNNYIGNFLYGFCGGNPFR